MQGKESSSKELVQARAPEHPPYTQTKTARSHFFRLLRSKRAISNSQTTAHGRYCGHRVEIYPTHDSFASHYSRFNIICQYLSVLHDIAPRSISNLNLIFQYFFRFFPYLIFIFSLIIFLFRCDILFL